MFFPQRWLCILNTIHGAMEAQQLNEAKPWAPPWTEIPAEARGDQGRSRGQGAARHILRGVGQHSCRIARSTRPGYTSPRISPDICSWIFKPQTRPNSTPIKVNKSLPLTPVAVGSGPYWCLLEARYKVWLLLHCYTSDPYSLHYLRACKQARNSDHTVLQTSICILDWHDESCRERFEYGLRRAVGHKNLQDAVKQSGSIKKLRWDSLDKGIIKCLTSITLLYLF